MEGQSRQPPNPQPSRRLDSTASLQGKQRTKKKMARTSIFSARQPPPPPQEQQQQQLVVVQQQQQTKVDMCPAPTTTTTTTAAAAAVAEAGEATKQCDLETCSPSAFANYLIQHRFSSNPNEGLSFLEAATKVLQKHCLEVTSQPQTCDNDNDDDDNDVLGQALTSTPLETSLITPRAGKFRIQLHENGLVATKATTTNDKTIQLVLPKGSVSHLLVFPKPEDCQHIVKNKPKPPNAHLVFLKLKESIDFPASKKPIDQVCFALSWNKQDGPTGPATGETATGWKEATASWKRLLIRSLKGDDDEDNDQKMVVAQIQPMQASPFMSHQTPDQSTTTGGMPFVKCYHGVQDGVLYPLEEGLLFYKPLKFLPRSSLHSIACGRGAGGQNSSRYVDMTLEMANQEQTEFTNIQREELGVLNEYIHTVLIPAMKNDVRGNGNNKNNKDETSNEEDTEDDEEDMGEEDEESDTDDDDENFVEWDEDEEEEEEDDDDSDDDEDDGFEVVQDDFAKELVKRKQSEESSTESESEDEPRRKTRRSG